MLTGPTVRALLLSAAASGMCATVSSVRAQSVDSRINSIQSQIKALNAELARVRRETAAKDAAIRAAQADAAQARATADQTQATVASIGRPDGFKSGDGRADPLMGLGGGAAHPANPSPKYDFTSLTSGASGNLAQSGGTSASAQNAGQTGRKGEFHISGVTIQLGGFFEGTALFRTRNEVADLASNFNAIPLAQSPQYREGEFRGSARQSRFTILFHGDVEREEHVSGYAEFDLQGAAPTANSNESNSYNPRVRQAYFAYDNDNWGVHVLAGQAWSLATLSKLGVTPRQEDLPATIDQQYVPGFTWARQPQLRIAKDFGGKYWLAASFENPQTTYFTSPNGSGVDLGTANVTNPGISNLTVGQAYSIDISPDVILKAAADPGWGHYEVFGLLRYLQSQVDIPGGSAHSNSRLAGGVGGGLILPVIAGKLDIEGRALAGYGIGRYGTSQLPDAVIGRSGASLPLPEVQALIGAIGHPVPTVELYSYVGTERIGRATFNVGSTPYGYGNALYSNAGCATLLSTAACVGNTSAITQGTLGAYWRFLKGDFGTVQAGVQYSYTRRDIFKGVTAANGSGNQSTDENTVFFSLRYLPFL